MSGETKLLKFSYGGVSFDFEIGAGERIISENIAEHGVWEDNQLQLYSSLIGSSGTFVDIGANVGVNTIFAKLICPEAKVFAIEPSPENYELLERNVRRSSRTDEIKLFNIAIADKPGSIGFAGSGTNAKIQPDSTTNLVSCDTLDGFAKSLDVVAIDLLKIDVEGFTDAVLSRSVYTLSISRNSIIEFSYGDIKNRLGNCTHSDIIAHSDSIFGTLKDHFDFFYYISRKSGLVKLSRTRDLFDVMSCEATVGDVLCTKKSVDDCLSDISFAFLKILELQQQNHRRAMDIISLREALNASKQ